MSGEQIRHLHSTTAPSGRRTGRRHSVAGPRPGVFRPGARADAAAEQVREAVRAALAEDRDRIARDLHDHVIQRVFAAALALHTLHARVTDDGARARLTAVIDQLDDAVHDIRSAIFDLRSGGPGDVLQRLHDLVGEAAAGALLPIVRISGPVDRRLRGATLDDVEAVVREAVSNAVRHSGGSRVSVSVDVTDDVVVEVADDGRGICPDIGRSGLANLAERARRRGGTLDVTALPGAGTRLCWRIPAR